MIVAHVLVVSLVMMVRGSLVVTLVVKVMLSIMRPPVVMKRLNRPPVVLRCFLGAVSIYATMALFTIIIS